MSEPQNVFDQEQTSSQPETNIASNLPHHNPKSFSENSSTSRPTPGRLASLALQKARQAQRIIGLERQLHSVNHYRAKQQTYLDRLVEDRQELLAYVQKVEQDRLNLIDYNNQLVQQLNALQSTLTFRAFNTLTSTAQKLRNLPDQLKKSWSGNLDVPASGEVITEALNVSGWVVSQQAPITRVEVYLDNVLLGEAKYGLERHDVFALRPWQTILKCGFNGQFKLSSGQFEPGPKILKIKAVNAKGQYQEFERSLDLVVLVLSPDEATSKSLTYEDWIAQHEPSAQELGQQGEQSDLLTYKPLISIITPVYNPSLTVLEAMLNSVSAQTYPYWELCLVDGGSTDPRVIGMLEQIAAKDSRIRLKLAGQNLGIIGNSLEAVKLAGGEFYITLDHDDVLAPNALYEVALALNANPKLDFIYSDHDLLSEDGSRRFDPLFKPDWSPEVLLSANYLLHLTMIRATLFHEVGGFQSDLEGVQDLDLFFRVTEKTEHIHHIPRILYHWRESAGSTATSIYNKPQTPQNQLKAVEAHLRRLGMNEATAFFDVSGFLRVNWPVKGAPRVSIIVPTKNKPELIRACVTTLLEKTAYSNYELVIVDTGSIDPEVFEFYQTLSQDERVAILFNQDPFNYSAVNNWAVERCHGEFLVFLNNDTEIIKGDWLAELLIWAQRPEIGVVGAKLLKFDNTIQHAGVIVGLGGFANHIFAGLTEGVNTIFGRTEWYRNYSAVTAACMMVRREVFEEVGGFDETFVLNGSDVSLCLEIGRAGYRVIYNPFARLYHLESATHQGRNVPTDYFLSREGYLPLLRSGDPFFSPNLSYYSLIPAFKPEGEKEPLETVDALLETLEQEAAPAGPAPDNSLMTVEVDKYSREASMFANWLDFSQGMLELSRQVHLDNPGPLEIKSICWFLPSFEHAFYGGIHTILRFAAYFHTHKGVTNRFVIINNYMTPGTVLDLINKPFPELAGSIAVVLDSLDDVQKLAPADAAVSTLWITAYYVLRYNAVKRKFNFVQDYEPLFYPAGSISAQVQASWRMGFYGVTNTGTLKEIYEDYYGGQAIGFAPAVNATVFRPGERVLPVDSKPPFKMFFYGRPGHPRNGFELGAVALRKVKAQLGDRVQIVTAGANWNPADYDLEGVVENLGLLSYEQTAALYRTCDVGFVMMFTRHPSYLPLELMASGCLVVTNLNPATRWLLEPEVNCLLAEASPTILADTIVRGLTDTTLRARITDYALKFIRQYHVEWSTEIEQVWDFMVSDKSATPLLTGEVNPGPEPEPLLPG